MFADPKGGLFAEPNLRKMVKKRGKDPGPDPNCRRTTPGPGLSKVLHVQDVDFCTHAPTHRGTRQVRLPGRRRTPRHVPVLILVELKDESMLALPTKPVRVSSAEELDGVDAEILSVFDRSEILTPDPGAGPVLHPARGDQGPGLAGAGISAASSCSRCDNENAVRDRYLKGHPALQDRLMFTSAVAPSPPRGCLVQYQRPGQGLRSHPEARPRRLPRPDSGRCGYRPCQVQRHHAARQSTGQQRSSSAPITLSPGSRRLTEESVRLPGGGMARPNPVIGDPAWGRVDLESCQVFPWIRARGNPWTRGDRRPGRNKRRRPRTCPYQPNAPARGSAGIPFWSRPASLTQSRSRLRYGPILDLDQPDGSPGLRIESRRRRLDFLAAPS